MRKYPCIAAHYLGRTIATQAALTPALFNPTFVCLLKKFQSFGEFSNVSDDAATLNFKTSSV